MESSLSILALIVQEVKQPEKCSFFVSDPLLKDLKPLLMKLTQALTSFEAREGYGIAEVIPIKTEDYDADVEGTEEHKYR